MRAASSRFLHQAGIATVILLIVGSLAGYAMYQEAQKRRTERVTESIDDLLNNDVSTALENVNKLKYEKTIAEPLLWAIQTDLTTTSDKRVRAAMGLIQFDSRYSQELVEAVMRVDCMPDELKAITDILLDSGFIDLGKFSTVFADFEAPPPNRLRALCANIRLQPGLGDVSQHAGWVANELCYEPPTTVDDWIAILKPIGPHFLLSFRDIFVGIDDANKASVLARAIFEFLPAEDRSSTFADLIRQANESQFDALLTTIEESGISEDFSKALASLPTEQMDDIAQTNVNIALARLGQDKPLIKQYSGDFALPSTIFAISFSTTRRLRTHSLRKLYERHSGAMTDDVNLRRSILQAFALQAPEMFDSKLQDWLTDIALAHVENDLDACCFSTSELILSRLGRGNNRPWRESRRKKSGNPDGVLGNVLIDPQGRAFSIFKYTNSAGRTKTFALATTESLPCCGARARRNASDAEIIGDLSW